MAKGGLLITGVTCSSGLFLLRLLKNNRYYEDCPVGLLVHREESVPKVTELFPEASLYCGDLTDMAFMDRVFSLTDYTTILHIAGIYTSKEITKVAIDYHVERIVLVHTTGMYSLHKNEASCFKKTEEEVIGLLENNKIDYTILRPTMIFGTNGDGTIERYVKMVSKYPIVPLVNKGRSLIQPVYYQDLSKAFYKVLKSPESTKNKCYNLSGESPITMLELHVEIGNQLSKKRSFVNIPLWLACFAAWFLKICSLGKIDKRDAILRMDENRDFSHYDATQDFGYAPLSFAKALRKSLEEQYLQVN